MTESVTTYGTSTDLYYHFHGLTLSHPTAQLLSVLLFSSPFHLLTQQTTPGHSYCQLAWGSGFHSSMTCLLHDSERCKDYTKNSDMQQTKIVPPSQAPFPASADLLLTSFLRRVAI